VVTLLDPAEAGHYGRLPEGGWAASGAATRERAAGSGMRWLWEGPSTNRTRAVPAPDPVAAADATQPPPQEQW